MSVQVPAPAGERWKSTLATSESTSLAVPFRVTVPARGEPGSVRLPVGLTLSTKKAAWWATHAPLLTVEAAAPVAATVGISFMSSAMLERFAAVPLACCTSKSSVQPPGRLNAESRPMP